MTGTSGEQRGQATVELALLLPLVLLLTLSVVQVGLVVHAQVRTTHAAREAARVVAVTHDPAAAEQAAIAAAGLDPARVEVEVEGAIVTGGMVTVRVRYRAPTTVPMIGAMVDDVALVAEVTMRLE
ncbi:MAG: pilus assembly protein [Acidimicrobiia bacterium]|nr:pilus assembly protein [Acidimicrobiia bacterium]